MTTRDRALLLAVLWTVLLGTVIGLALAAGCSTVKRYTLPGYGTMQGVGSFDGSHTHGIWLDRAGYPVDQVELDALVEDVIRDWTKAVPESTIRAALKSGGDKNNYLVFRPFPFVHPQCPASVGGVPHTCYGLTLGGRIMLVGYREPLESTALRAELGAVIYARLVWRPGHTERTLQEYTEEHGIRR